MIRFKGRLSIRQYLPNKPTKWGIKQYFLCESKTGYALKFITYCGRGTIPVLQSFSTTESIVLSLLDGFENHGHIVYTDNFYSSPRLFKELERRKIGACGTVKPGRKDMPSDLHPKNLNLDRGEMPVFRRTGNLIACAWHDTKRVHFLSNVHANGTVEKRIRSKGTADGHRVIQKPLIADAYNQHMGGVDILDQKVSTFGWLHKETKWYRTIYHRLVEIALINSYIVYQKSEENPISQRKFRQQVIDGLLQNYAKDRKCYSRPSLNPMPDRLTERHFVSSYVDSSQKPDCIVCSDRKLPGWKRKQTHFKCKQCDLPMCSSPCHELFHTHRDFKAAAAKYVYHM